MNKLYLKKIISYLLYNFGLVYLTSNNYRKSLILCYHHVVPKGDKLIDFIEPGMYVTEETFEKHIKFLSRRYNIISLENLSDLTIKNTCIITFDDGWADNFSYAFPILKKYQVPATIFLSTNLIGTTNWPWPDRISYYIRYSTIDKIREIINILEDKISDVGVRQIYKESLDFKDNFLLAAHIISYLKTLSHENICLLIKKIDKYFHPLGEYLNVNRPWLTWDEIKEMHNHNISFGSHTHNHVILTNTSEMIARDEIIISQSILSKKLNQQITMFSYPSSYYNENILNILKDQAFKIAVTTRSQSIDKSDSLLALKRFYIHEDITNTIPMLACLISNTF